MIDCAKYIKKLQKILTNDELNCFKNNHESLIDFGCEYLEIGDYKKAFQIFSIGFRLNGFDIDVMNGIGVSLCELGRLKISKSILEKTAEFYPDDAITHANLAAVNWEQGDLDKAIYYYNKSIEIDPNIQETHYNLINLYYEKGHLFMAYITSLNLLNIDPYDKQAKAARDEILFDLGFSIF